MVGFLLFEVAFYAAYRYGMGFGHTTASPFWFPDSVLLCALLRARPRTWWVFLLGALPIRLFAAVPSEATPSFLLLCTLIDSAKGVAAALILRRVLANPLRFGSVREFLLYFLWVVVLVPAAGAFADAAVRHSLGHDYWQAWEQGFLGSVLTQLVITPLALYWLLDDVTRELRRLSARQWLEIGGLVLGLGLASYLAVGPRTGTDEFHEPTFYAVIPFLFWAAMRFGMIGATGAVSVLALFIVAAALQEHGPFSGLSPANKARAMQQLLLLRVVPLYLVALFAEQNHGIERSLRASERSLRASERRYREVLDSQADLVCRYLPDTTLTFVNAACCRFFGCRSDELLGRRFLDLLPEELRERVRPHILEGAERCEPCSWEQELVLPTGAVVWQHWNSYPIASPDGPCGELQAIGRDITDRKRVEEANLKLTHVSRLAVLGELTAMVAHEIKQPLGAILSNAEAMELLLDAPDPPLDEIRHILLDIRRSDLRADQVIGRIRGLLTKRDVEFQPVDLNEIVTDVLVMVAGDASRQRIRIRQELAPALPRVLGDPIYLQQVLLNLVVNAMDAMKETPPAGRVLRLATSVRGASVEVSVADCGHGIPESVLATVFKSFFTTKAHGMGLGLAIARSIIETHRGWIGAANNPERGATFSFRLPAARSVDAVCR